MLLKVCLNGARDLVEHPRLSADPDAVADEAAASVAAGAGAVHVHPKDDAGTDSLRADDISRFVEAIRRACPGVPIGVTTGAWSEPDPQRRAAAVRAWSTLPDFASVNWHEDGADEVAAALRELGVGIEAGLWNEQGLAAWGQSPLRTECLRALIELPDDGDTAECEQLAHRLIDGVRRLAPGLPVLLHGEGRSTWPAVSLAAGWGVDTRIGLEDTLTLPDGAPAAGNAQLVHAARAILEAQASS